MTMFSSPLSSHVICLLCRALVPCTRQNPGGLVKHLQGQHNHFYSNQLLVKLHLMDRRLLDLIMDFNMPLNRSVDDSEQLLKKLLTGHKFDERKDSFVSIETNLIDDLAVNIEDHTNDNIEGSERFYREKSSDIEYADMENEQNRDVNVFINSLPKDLNYFSKFDETYIDDGDDHIEKRIDQMDQSLDDIHVDEELKKNRSDSRMECPVCKKILNRLSLKKHMSSFHNGIKAFAFECELCNEKYETKMELFKHCKQEHQKPGNKRGRKPRLNRLLSNTSALDESLSSMDSLQSKTKESESNANVTTLSNISMDENTMDGMSGHDREESDSKGIDVQNNSGKYNAKVNKSFEDNLEDDISDSELLLDDYSKDQTHGTLNISIQNDAMDELIDNFFQQ